MSEQTSGSTAEAQKHQESQSETIQSQPKPDTGAIEQGNVLKQETESQVIVKNVSGKSMDNTQNEPESDQKEDEQPQPPVQVWQGTTTEGAFSYHSKGRVVRKKQPVPVQVNTTKTQFQPEDRWATKTESSASFHSTGKRRLVPVEEEIVEEVIPVRRNERVVKRSSGSYMSFHRRPMTEPEPVYVLVEDVNDVAYEEPVRGDVWSRMTESMVEHHNRRPRISDVVDDGDEEEDEEEVYEQPQSWGEVGESSMHFHSRGRKPVSRRVVLHRWNPEDYEIVEVPSTIIKRGTGSSLSFHSTGRRRLVKKEVIEAPVEVQTRRRGNIVSKETESSHQFHHRPHDYEESYVEGGEAEGADEAANPDQPPNEEVSQPSGDVWSKATESMVEHHNRRPRVSDVVENQEEPEEPSDDNEVHEHWGEVGPSSMHFHSRGRKVRRSRKENIVPSVEPKKYYYETNPVDRRDMGSALSFHGGKRKVIAVGPSDEVYEVIESPSGRVYRQDTGSMLRYHFRRAGEPDPMFREEPRTVERSDGTWARASEYGMEYHSSGARRHVRDETRNPPPIFDPIVLKSHFALNWRDLHATTHHGSLGAALFELFEPFMDIQEAVDLLLYFLRESKSANNKDVNAAVFFTEIHRFISLLNERISNGQASKSLKRTFNRFYEFAQTVQADIIGSYVKRNVSDIIDMLTHEQSTLEYQRASTRIVRRLVSLESQPGRALLDMIVRRTDISTVNKLVRSPYIAHSSDAVSANTALGFICALTGFRMPLLGQALNVVSNHLIALDSQSNLKSIAVDLPTPFVYFLLKSLHEKHILDASGDVESKIQKLGEESHISSNDNPELAMLEPEPWHELVSLGVWH